MDINFGQIVNNVIDWFATTGVNAILKVVIALLIMWISFKIINRLTRRLEKRILAKKKADKTLTITLFYAMRIALKVLIVVCLIGYVGIDTSGIAALIASLGVGVGLAVNGTLSNFAGGVLLILTRPFKVDDYIEAGGYEGTVEDIHIVFTIIRTVDNKLVYVPNGTLSTSTIVNYTAKDLRRLDLTFSISRAEDFKKAENVILATANGHNKVLSDPMATARISEHTLNECKITLKAWVKTDDYWDVYFDLQEDIKTAMDDYGIVGAVSQLEVRMK
ncbi:MAG: mechanosensitive ion channel family protein [Clostridiales bacterium]|nr:mechanosensitive ion channel family protein [Clostridiales bacterium]